MIYEDPWPLKWRQSPTHLDVVSVVVDEQGEEVEGGERDQVPEEEPDHDW